MRLFVALSLSPPWHECLRDVQDSLRRHDSRRAVRWVDSDGIHLTLRFLGEVADARVGAVARGVETAINALEAPELAPEGLGAFPNPRRPRVIWAGVREVGTRLAGVQAAVEQAMGLLGWEPESRHFHPHLTLGRVRDPRRGVGSELTHALETERVATWEPAVERRVVLMRSHLSPRGARYEVLGEWRLG